MRELTIALDGALELTLRTLARVDVRAGAAVRVALAPEVISVWPLAGPRAPATVAASPSAPSAQPPM